MKGRVDKGTAVLLVLLALLVDLVASQELNTDSEFVFLFTYIFCLIICGAV